MSTEQNVITITRIAGADLSASQYLFVEQSSAGTITVCNAAGENAIGVLQNNPASGQAGTVAVGGVTKVVASAAITIGAQVGTSAAGKAVTATTGQKIFGEALSTAANANDIISVLLRTGAAAA